MAQPAHAIDAIVGHVPQAFNGMPTLAPHTEAHNATAELQAWLQITQADGIGPISARALLSALGAPRQALHAGPRAWRQVLNERQCQGLQAAASAAATQTTQTLAWLAGGPHRHVLPLDHPHYPAALLRMPDPPLLLFALGRLELLHRPALAMVGSRHPTPQGQTNAEAFARALSEAGLTIVSGLALGIDGAAHQGALHACAPSGPDGIGSSIAIVGTGVDRVYPREHHELAHRLATQGLLLSEFPLGTPPLRGHFPKRNRLIAGLSLGTLVVEAAIKSGSLITARLAADLGREVFAIPGSIHAPQSRGCHALIQQGAKLVESAQDVLEELKQHGALRPLSTLATPLPAAHPIDPTTMPPSPRRTRPGPRRHPAPSPPPPAAAAPADPVLAALGYDATDLDTLCARTGMDAAALNVRLLTLELQGDVARLPGQRFQRVGLG